MAHPDPELLGGRRRGGPGDLPQRHVLARTRAAVPVDQRLPVPRAVVHVEDFGVGPAPGELEDRLDVVPAGQPGVDGREIFLPRQWHPGDRLRRELEEEQGRAGGDGRSPPLPVEPARRRSSVPAAKKASAKDTKAWKRGGARMPLRPGTIRAGGGN